MSQSVSAECTAQLRVIPGKNPSCSSTELITSPSLGRGRSKTPNCFWSLGRSRAWLLSLCACQSDRPLYKLQHWLAAVGIFFLPLWTQALAASKRGAEESHLFASTIYLHCSQESLLFTTHMQSALVAWACYGYYYFLYNVLDTFVLRSGPPWVTLQHTGLFHTQGGMSFFPFGRCFGYFWPINYRHLCFPPLLCSGASGFRNIV